IGGLIGEYLFFQDVYLQTRWMPAIREQTAKVADLHQQLGLAREAVSDRLREYSAELKRSTWFSRTFGRLTGRTWLDSFWRRYASHKWRLILPTKFLWHIRMLGCAISECWYSIRFSTAILTAVLRQKV
ncbi:MAG: hypothetical protein AAB499_00140, partial [Patescibacteria group bacterium]